MNKNLSTCIVLATFNGSRFIESQLDSIRNQSVPLDHVIIHDDKSTDDTFEKISKYIQKYNLNNWELSRNEKNLGYENNFYSLMCLVKDDIIFLCDQDDIWNRTKVEKCLQLFKSDEKIMVIGTDNDFKVLNSRKKSKELKLMKFDNSIEKINLKHKNFLIGKPGCDIAVRKEYFNKIKDYWINKWAQDEFLWKFSFIDSQLYLYHFCGITRRIHENNTAKNEGKKKYRNLIGRKNHIQIETDSFHCLKKYIDKYYPCDKKRSKIIEDYIDFNKTRLKLLNTKNPILILKLLFNLKNYPRKKGFFVDILVTYGLIR